MENTERMVFPGVGKYEIPEIKPETNIRIDKLEWIPVNYALTAKNRGAKDFIFIKMITNLKDFGTIQTSIFRFYKNLARYVLRIFLCMMTCHWQYKFLCTIRSTGLPPTGRLMESM